MSELSFIEENHHIMAWYIRMDIAAQTVLGEISRKCMSMKNVSRLEHEHQYGLRLATAAYASLYQSWIITSKMSFAYCYMMVYDKSTRLSSVALCQRY